MTRYVAQRFAAGLGVLLVVSFLVFWLGTLIPGDLSTVLVGSEGATQQQYRELRHRLGLDQPIVVQYAHWLGGALRGNLGKSPITGLYATAEIARRAPITLELALLALAESIVLGVFLGVFTAVRAHGVADVMVRAILFVMFAIPPFVAGVLLVLAGALFLKPLYQVGYVPLGQSVGLNLRSMLLPSVSIAVPLAAMTAQMTRTSLLETLGQPYIVTAMAKGAPPRLVIYRHALKNALAPIITLQGYVFGSLVGGLIVTEQVFNLDGLASGLLAAIGRRDYSFVVTGTLVIAATYIFANLLVDLLYPIVDPTQRA
jgi:peptide/nickel transport system permease protein